MLGAFYVGLSSSVLTFSEYAFSAPMKASCADNRDTLILLRMNIPSLANLRKKKEQRCLFYLFFLSSFCILHVHSWHWFYLLLKSMYQHMHVHFVPRAPVREVSSRVYLSTYCLNRYNTMHFTRFRHRRNATYKLNWLNRVKCIVFCGFKQ